jgi:hypothetical protein
VTGKASDEEPDVVPPDPASESFPEPQLVTARAAASSAVPRTADRDDMRAPSGR